MVIMNSLKFIPILIVFFITVNPVRSNSHHSQPLSPPSGFVDEVVIDQLPPPRAFTFAPDGRIFLLLVGTSTSNDTNGASVAVYKNGALLQQRALELGVCGDGERGLLGIALSPEFTSTGHLFLYYTRFSPTSPYCAFGTYQQNLPGPRNRVSRFTMVGDTIEESTESVLIDTIASDTGVHNAGDLHFGADGYLYISVGDSGITPSPASAKNNLNGKILRVLPSYASSGGYSTAGNPFDTAANAQSCGLTQPNPSGGPCREVFAYGLRNPYRFTIKPGTNELYAGDVGGGQWEEITQIEAGQDHGYPFIEGPCPNSSCSSVEPMFAYSHTVGEDAAVIGGAFMLGNSFPPDYRNQYYYGDYSQAWIRRLKFNANTNEWESFAFAPDVANPIGIKQGPDGCLYYLTLKSSQKQLRRICATGSSNQAPTAKISATPQSGPLSTIYTFSAVGSSDPDGDLPLTYVWNLGNGITYSSTSAVEVTTTYSITGPKIISLTVIDNGTPPLSSPVVSTTVYPGSMAPVATIVLTNTTASRSLFHNGDTWQFAAVNPTSTVGLAAQPYEWEIEFHHRDHHHPFMSGITAANGQFSIPLSGEPEPQVWYRIKLKITDAQGQTNTIERDVMPEVVNVKLDTFPSGGQVYLDNVLYTTPITITHVAGYMSGIDVASPQSINGATHYFIGWHHSDEKTTTFRISPLGSHLYAFFSNTQNSTIKRRYLPIVFR
jgi:glucose/arabinose dehydrogenase